MPISDTSPKHKRDNLFLLRVWCDDENVDEHGDEDEEPYRIWHGKVQRTVSGEEHSFGAKEDLIEVLEAMIYKDRKSGRSRASPRREGLQVRKSASRQMATTKTKLRPTREVT
jgi:hypothetical protein